MFSLLSFSRQIFFSKILYTFFSSLLIFLTFETKTEFVLLYLDFEVNLDLELKNDREDIILEFLLELFCLFDI